MYKLIKNNNVIENMKSRPMKLILMLMEEKCAFQFSIRKVLFHSASGNVIAVIFAYQSALYIIKKFVGVDV